MPTARIPAAGVVNGVLYAVVALLHCRSLHSTSPGAAQLDGGNIFTGNQTVNGSVSATNLWAMVLVSLELLRSPK